MTTRTPEKPILLLTIRSELDVVLARKRARQVALLLGFDTADQTRISTAVSEIARNAFIHAGGGKLEFSIQDAKLPYTFLVKMSDSGPGISNLDEVLAERQPYNGLRGATKLVDKFTVDSNTSGTIVQLEKKLAPRLPFTGNELDGIANSLTKLISANPTDEVYQQNQELLQALEQLSAVKAQLDVVNVELQESNTDLTALNTEMKDWNLSLEEKVAERTAELQQLNVELEAARDQAVVANELKTQFVANVSHELRTPLAGILGLSEVLVTEDLDEGSKEIAEHILKAGHHLLSIVIAVSDAVDPELRDCFHGDSQRLKQVILNLAHNAVKFTDKGRVSLKALLLSKDKETSRVRIEVSDEGIGISEANQTRLFQPFVQVDGSTTRKYGGTGLGLAISRTIVEQMGGTIGCESNDGLGSLFYFEVPLKKAKNH
ncbi:MAG: hypothetical protein HYX67_00890 [Candidatus Melainabacteria bacterium]|nr:hypothetical protein [Candidatus Melainabacteria bacterium]